MAISAPPVPPPSGATGGVSATQLQQTHSLGEVVVEVVPERLALLSRTILLSGTVTGEKQGGALILKTQMGELIIRSPTPLPLDRVLLLQIPPGAPPVRAQVSILGALPTASPTTVTAGTAPSGAATPSAPLPAPAPTLPPPVSASHTTSGAAPALLSVDMTTVGLSALEALPVLPGSVMPAKVLALPVPYALPPSGAMPQAPLQLPSAVTQAAPQLLAAGSPALAALLSAGLRDVIAHLPANVLNPPPSLSASVQTTVPSPLTAAPGTTLSAPLDAGKPMAPSVVSSVSSLPKFAALPAVLTLPPGSVVTVQVNMVTAPQPSSPTPQQVQSPPSLPVQTQIPAQIQASALSAPSPLSAPPPADMAQSAPTSLPQASVPPATAVSAPAIKARPIPLSFMTEVVGVTPQGEPMATSPVGLLILDTKSPLPVGSKVEISLLHIAEPQPEAAEADLPVRLQDWPALQSALTALREQGLPAPAPGPRADLNLGSATLFLLSAFKMGGEKTLLPRGADEALAKSGKAGLLTALGDEVRQAMQGWGRSEASAPQTIASEWKSLTLPLPPDSAMLRLSVHMKDEREEGPAQQTMAFGKRLVVEFEMSRLGPMLLDGLIYARRMEMKLRSQRRLPAGLHDELRHAYRDSLNAMGWTGELEFQTAADLWLGR